MLDRVRAATPSEFVLVIAHNNENCLKFPDGSELDLEELYSNLATPRFRGLVLTCESVKYAKGETDALLTTTRLEYDEIACALKTALDRGAPGEKCRCVDTLLRAIQRELVSCSGALERVVKIGIASVGSGIVVASVYLIHSADDDDEEEQQENPDRVGEETNSETSGRKAKAGDR